MLHWTLTDRFENTRVVAEDNRSTAVAEFIRKRGSYALSHRLLLYLNCVGKRGSVSAISRLITPAFCRRRAWLLRLTKLH